MKSAATERRVASRACKKIGEQLTADWTKRAGARDGEAVIAAYKKM